MQFCFQHVDSFVPLQKSASSEQSVPDCVIVDKSNGAIRRSVICLLHIASASLLCIEHCTVQTDTTVGAQAPVQKKSACLALLVHPGIRVLRYPDLVYTECLVTVLDWFAPC